MTTPLTPQWRPTATIDTLKKRAQLLQALRAFFYARNVYEVDTPILNTAATPDLHIESLQTAVKRPGLVSEQTLYFHTSPEFSMKRLLCAGSGDIFYLGKVFRNGDISKRHQIEFTLLEWYRVGFSMQNLIDEVVCLIQHVFRPQVLTTEIITYQQAFSHYASIPNILTATAADCRHSLTQHNAPEVVGVDDDDKELWEQLVFTEIVEPKLGFEHKNKKPRITCLYHYPKRDAALAQIAPNNPAVAERFEMFVKGMELANGYHELQDANVYKARFKESIAQRKQAGLTQYALDDDLIHALKEGGLPDCSGVALGVDRLFMLIQSFNEIQQSVPFGMR